MAEYALDEVDYEEWEAGEALTHPVTADAPVYLVTLLPNELLVSRVGVWTEPVPDVFADDLDVSAPEADMLPSEAALPEPQAAVGPRSSSG